MLTKEQIAKLKSPPHVGEKVTAQIIDVYDGDTCTAIYYIDKEPFMIHVRLANIDAPEKKSRNKLEKVAGNLVSKCVADIIDKKMVTLEILGWDKYGGRIVANIYLDDKTPITKHTGLPIVAGGNNTLSQFLLDNKLVKSFSGKTKKEKWSNDELDKIINFFNGLTQGTNIV